MKLPPNPQYSLSVTVSPCRTFETAGKLKTDMPEERVAVLNFASATSPGGGVKNGARAQEESLCRCSTLYPCLSTDKLWKGYYGFHRENWNICYSDSVIYTPDVLVIKSDINIPERLPQEKWFKTDVITCAAPNLRRSPNALSSSEQFQVHCERARRILSSAAIGGATVLVLGAFGCGAFSNIPEAVAEAYKTVLHEFEGYFKKVEFAVFCSSTEERNYSAFKSAFSAN